MTTDPRQSLGIAGEELACRELQRRGYAILDRRYRTRYGEIDIVARDGQTYVFVEVKARQGSDFGDPAEAVTLQKQRRVTQMAVDFLTRHRLVDVSCRFDVVAISLVEGGAPRVEVYVNAYDAA